MKLVLIFLVLISFRNVFAENQPYLDGEFDLIEYFFEDVTGIENPVHCTEAEIADGLWDLIFFGDGKAPGRELKSSYHPLHRHAAWTLSNDSCQSQRPYYNGVGIDYIDKKTGAVTFYIAAFNAKEIDKSDWENSDGWALMAQFFQRDFDVINIEKFEGHCRFESQSEDEDLREWKLLPFPWKYKVEIPKVLRCEHPSLGYLRLRKR